MEQGKISEAETEKVRVENLQRNAARERAEQSEEYVPRFFLPDSNGEFCFNKLYWSKREDPKNWDSIPKLW